MQANCLSPSFSTIHYKYKGQEGPDGVNDVLIMNRRKKYISLRSPNIEILQTEMAKFLMKPSGTAGAASDARRRMEVRKEFSFTNGKHIFGQESSANYPRITYC